MFIATRVARSAKLRRSGMDSHSLGHCRRSVGAKIPGNAAPPELAWVSEEVVVNCRRRRKESLISGFSLAPSEGERAGERGCSVLSIPRSCQ